MKEESRSVTSVAYSPDGTRIVTGISDGTTRVWDAQSGRTLRELKAHTEQVNCVAFSPDGMRVATAGGNSVEGPGEPRVWDARTSRSCST